MYTWNVLLIITIVIHSVMFKNNTGLSTTTVLKSNINNYHDEELYSAHKLAQGGKS